VHAVAYRNFKGRSPVKSISFGSQRWKATSNRGHS